MDKRRIQRRVTPSDQMAGAAILGLLFAVYWFTASFTFTSDDELFMFDTTESFARRGSVMRNITADLDWPGHTYVEPVQPLLSVPVFWISDRFERTGNVHATLLFNVVVTAATATALFLYVRRLSYSRGVAATVALLFGLTTIAWPYSKTYFREPLGTLTLFLAAYCLLCWRQSLVDQEPWPHRWLLLAITAAAASVLAKESGVVGIPMLLLVPLIGHRNLPRGRAPLLRLALMVAVLFALAVGGLHLYTQVLGAAVYRFHPVGRMTQAFNNLGNLVLAGEGVFGLLFSPGKGVFWHSPILVLALLAPWLPGNRRFDTSWPILLLLTFVVVYALVRENMWFGGTNWGPRYLVPATPFLMMGVAPAIDRIRAGSRWGPWCVVIALLALAGLAVQVGAISVSPMDYYDVLDRTGIPGAPWTVALWVPYYAAILGHWRLLLAGAPLDFAWVQAGTNGPEWLLTTALLMAAAAFSWTLACSLRREVGRATLLGFLMVGGLLLAALTWFGLRRIYPDKRYQGDNEALHTMRSALQDSALPDPVIYLNNRTYSDFMLNYYKGNATWYTLALNPNELVQPGELPPPPNSEPFELLYADVWSPVDYFSRQHQTSLLVMETGPYHMNVVRPMEWWMNVEFHRIRTQQFDDNVRLIGFSSTAAPERTAEPEFRLDLVLGEAIALRGFDPQPPAGLIAPGRVVNLSTQWQALQSIDHDYTIGTYLMTMQGKIALQDDSVPVGGFWPTHTWGEGDIIRHNVAFVFPSDLPPGHYEIWTLMYSPIDGARLPVTDSTGTTIRDHVVLYSVEVMR